MITVIIILIVLFIVYLAWNQEKLIYPGTILGKEEIPYPKIYNSYYSKGITGNIWIFFNGNNSKPSDSLGIIPKADSFLSIVYPGYNGNKQKINPDSTVANIRKIMKRVKRLGYKPENTNIICYSIGCAIAINWLSKDNQEKYKRLILVAPFWSLDSVIYNKYSFPSWLIKLLLNHNWYNENIKYINNNIKVEIYHGKNDKLIPYTHSEKLAKIKNATLVITDHDHNSITSLLNIIIKKYETIDMIFYTLINN